MKRNLFLTLLILPGLLQAAYEITVTSPNGGETWVKGSRRIITWSSKSIGGEGFKITLMKGGIPVGTIAQGLSSSTNEFHWKVGDSDAPFPGDGANYRIQVEHQGGTALDFSDNPFTISSEPLTQTGVTGKLISLKIRVTSPDAASTWYSGDTYTIRWETPVKNVFTIELYGPGRTRKYDTIGTMLPLPTKKYGGKYSYSWSIPANYAHIGQRRIRVSTLNGSTSGFSRTFTLNQATTQNINKEISHTSP